MKIVHVESAKFNEDRSKLMVRVKGDFTSGGHSVEHEVARNEQNEVSRVIIVHSPPTPGSAVTSVMVYFDETYTVDGPFADSVVIEAPAGSVTV